MKNDFKEKVWKGKFTCEIKIEIAHNDGWRLSHTI